MAFIRGNNVRVKIPQNPWEIGNLVHLQDTMEYSLMYLLHMSQNNPYSIIRFKI